MVSVSKWIAALLLAMGLTLAPSMSLAAEKDKVEINSASAADLEELPGIGAKAAAKIIENRPYRNSADLEKKAELTPATIAKFRDLISFRAAGEKEDPKTADKKETTKKETTAKEPTTKAPATTKAAGKVNLNTATAKELEELTGVGAATSKKIIDNRPYKSVADFESKSGIPAGTIAKFKDEVTVGASIGSTATTTPKTTTTNEPATKAPATKEPTTIKAGKVNVNTATAKELEALPGVGPATSKKIIEGRPFKSLAELESKAGLTAAVVAKFKDDATVGAATNSTATTTPKTPTTTPPKTNDPPKTTKTDPPKTTTTPKTDPPKTTDKPSATLAKKVDVNNASQEDLESLPDVGPVNAEKIIDGRPFKNVDAVEEVVGAARFAKIKDLISAGSTKIEVVARKPPTPGMVWVNTESGIFHKEGDQWYGKTKNGKWMLEADAIKAGHTLSKNTKSDNKEKEK